MGLTAAACTRSFRLLTLALSSIGEERRLFPASDAKQTFREGSRLISQRDSVKDFAKARIAPERVKDWVDRHLQRKPVGFLRHFR